MQILRSRLDVHQLVDPPPATAVDVVRWMCAVQAQDYGGARWAVAQRTQALTGAEVDRALADGDIIRTHVLRPTWHLVAASDLRWLLALTSPRVKAQAAYGHRLSGLDGPTIAKSNRVLARSLEGRQLTRAEIEAELRSAGVVPRNAIATGHLLLAAELDGVICSGAMRGKLHTHALLDERVPPADPYDREVALAELAGRYVASHGPATIKDFAWWSGLSVADATEGVRTAEPRLEPVEDGAVTYWVAPGTDRAAGRRAPSAHLLANFDEYTVGYTDRGLLMDAADARHLEPRPELLFNNVVLVDGRVAGTWKRVQRKAAVSVTVRLFRPVDTRQQTAITGAAQQYASHLELPLELDRAYYEG